MPVTVRWLIKNKVVFVRMIDEINGSAVKEIRDAIDHMLESEESSRVHVLVDISRVEVFPQISTFLRTDISKHEKVEWIVLSGIPNQTARFAAEVVAQVARFKLHITHNLEEAVDFIKTIETSLHDIPLPTTDDDNRPL